VRLLHHSDVLDVVAPLYDQVARWRVGSIDRPEWMWRRTLRDAGRPVDTPFGKGVFVAVHSDGDGRDDGYVHYEVDWDESFAANPVGHGKVLDLWGATSAVEIELWRFLLDIDLVVGWQAATRPVDEPVRRVMHDARAYEVRQRLDEQWLRLLDVAAALAVRTYGPVEGSVAIAVDDPMFAANCGTWQVSTDGAVATDRSADVDVDVATLSAAYLGGVSWQDLAATGAVRAADRTIELLDALFATRPTPFCGTFY
jgi:predicted acetyltransferase